VDDDRRLIADADANLRHQSIDGEPEHAAVELVPGAQVETADLGPGAASERRVEVALVEQPFPSDSATGQLARASQRLNALDVQVEIGGRLISAQESHVDPYNT